MTHPSWLARIQILGLSMKNDQHLPDSPGLPGSSAVGRSPSSCRHRWQKSIQKCKPPSFQTNTTALHHTLWLGWIGPESNISHRCIWTFSTNGGGFHLNCSLNGMLLVTWITCSIEWVQLSLLGSKEKTSWYSAKRDWAESTSLGGFQSTQI